MTAIHALNCDNGADRRGAGNASTVLTHLPDLGERGLGVSLPSEEQWRPVLGYEGLYEVSDQGRVRSITRRVARSDGRPRTISERILKPVAIPGGRYNVSLCREGVPRPRRVAVVVLEAFVGPRPPGQHACHNDGNSMNDVLTNLRWDTTSENMHDRVRHGTHHHAIKQRCPWGHLLAEPNLVVSMAKRGIGRGCRACNTARKARSRARKAGAIYDMQYESDLIYARIMQTKEIAA